MPFCNIRAFILFYHAQPKFQFSYLRTCVRNRINSVVKRVSVYTTLRQYVLRSINVAKKIGSAAKGERRCIHGTQQQGCS